MAEANVEDPATSPERRAQAAAEVEGMIHDFLSETGWHPASVKAAAGALLYTKYNFVIRFVMKRIARTSAGGTDTSQDHEYTAWEALDRLVDELALPDPSPTARSSTTQ